MRIKTIRGTAIKGATFSHDLAPVTLLHGSNFTNKSTRVEALTLALAGYLPSVAKKPNELFDRLASGNPMEVEAEADDGRSVRRCYTQSGGTVSCKVIGGLGDWPPVALDPNEYLGLSGPAQTRYLFGCATLPEQCTVPNLTKTVCANIKNIKLEENSEVSEEVIDKLVKAVTYGDEAFPLRSNELPQEWVARLAEALRLSKNSADASRKRMEQTGQGLAQVGAQQAPAPQDAEQRLHKARQGKSAADQEVTKLQTQRDDLAKRWTEANGKVKAGQGANLGQLEAEKEEINSKLHKWQALDFGRPKNIKQGAAWTVAEWTNVQQSRQQEVFKLDSGYTAGMNKIQELEEEHDAAEKAKVCHECGQPLDKAKRKKNLDRLKREIVQAEKSTAEFKRNLEAAQTLRDAAAEQRRKAQEREAEERSVKDAISNAHQRLGEIGQQVSAYGAVADAAKLADQLLKEGQALKPKLTVAQERQGQAAALVSEAEEAYKLLLAQRAEASAKAKAAAEARRVRVECEVLKEAGEVVASLQEDLVNASVGPLVATMNELAGPLLDGKVSFRDGELVMCRTDGLIHSYKSMSGTQKALAFAALSLALASKAPCRIVCLDEVGRIDPSRKLKLYQHLVTLCQAKVIDQAVCIDVAPCANVLPQEWFKGIEIK